MTGLRPQASKAQAVVVLKGAGSLVAAPGRVPVVIGAGNPGMATGGMGDVLSGVVASLLAQGRRFDNAANTVPLAGFATVDLYARYRIDPQWSVSLRLNNLADKVYETARGYNQPGRAAYVTLDWSPVR